MKLVCLPLLVLLSAGPLGAQELPDESVFDSVLTEYNRDGLIDYAGLQENRGQLDRYLESLAKVDTSTLESASRKARLAFWINAYNACTLRRVIDNYPVERRRFAAGLVNTIKGIPDNSIRQIPKTFTEEFCPVAGRERSLDEIEHQILRPMGDPRIHFAINCAARSCPRLASRAYREAEVDVELDDAVRRFINDPQHFSIDRESNEWHLNKVLDWFGEDFGGPDGLREFFSRYVNADVAAYLMSGVPRIKFNDYDWTLNDTAVFGGSD